MLCATLLNRMYCKRRMLLFSVVLLGSPFLKLPQDKWRLRRAGAVIWGGGGLEPNKKTVQKAWAYSTLLPLCTAFHSCEDNPHVPLLQLTLFWSKILTYPLIYKKGTMTRAFRRQVSSWISFSRAHKNTILGLFLNILVKTRGYIYNFMFIPGTFITVSLKRGDWTLSPVLLFIVVVIHRRL